MGEKIRGRNRTPEELAYDLRTETRLCTTCGQRKSFSEFSKSKPSADGRNSKCKECSKKYAKRYYRSNQQRRREQWLQSEYDLSLEKYNEMHEQQDGKCAICGSAGTYSHQSHLAVDHNHETGEVRELLCGTCNNALGLFKDDPALLRKAAAYIEKHK